MNGQLIKQKRTGAGIPGTLLCDRAKVDRGRLSNIERGYVRPTEAEATRLDTALDELIGAKRELEQTAIRLGWPVSAI